jgi:hypothetical protein
MAEHVFDRKGLLSVLILQFQARKEITELAIPLALPLIHQYAIRNSSE